LMLTAPTVSCGLKVLTNELCSYSGSAVSNEASYGSGMVVNFKRGRGEIFNAGTCEWVSGLIKHDDMTMFVTRNVLNKFTGRNFTSPYDNPFDYY